MNKKVFLITACFLVIIGFLPVSLPILNKILEAEIGKNLNGHVEIGCSFIVPLRNIQVRDISYSTKNKGLSFFAEAARINYDLLNFLRLRGHRFNIRVDNLRLAKGPAISTFEGILNGNDDLPIFYKVKISSSRKGTDMTRNVFSAIGAEITLAGEGTQIKNGNIIDYKLDIKLKGGMSERFKQSFLMASPEDKKEIKIMMLIKGTSNNPYITIISDQFKLNFQLNRKNG